MENNPTDSRAEFEKWFKESAKSPIDPWHKEFAWSVWQAALQSASCGARVIIYEDLSKNPYIIFDPFKDAPPTNPKSEGEEMNNELKPGKYKVRYRCSGIKYPWWRTLPFLEQLIDWYQWRRFNRRNK